MECLCKKEEDTYDFTEEVFFFEQPWNKICKSKVEIKQEAPQCVRIEV